MRDLSLSGVPMIHEVVDAMLSGIGQSSMLDRFALRVVSTRRLGPKPIRFGWARWQYPVVFSAPNYPSPDPPELMLPVFLQGPGEYAMDALSLDGDAEKHWPIVKVLHLTLNGLPVTDDVMGSIPVKPFGIA